MAIDVVPGLRCASHITETGPVGFPPASGHGVGRAGVVPVYRATERRVALAAHVVAIALLAAARTDRGVR